MNAVTNITFAIPDFQTGSDIIARLPMANPAQAANDLERLLDSLVTMPPDSETYFRLLEHARLPIAFVTEDLAKRYLNKPLPLGDVEEDLFQQVTSLWRKAARAYAHCAERDSPDDHGPAHAQRVATTLHRCIQNTGMNIVEHLRARREMPWGLWLDLHGYYASAEEWEIATLTITDPLEPLGRSTHIQAAYVSFLLCDMAGCYSLSLRDQALMRRWATYWAPLVGLRKAQQWAAEQGVALQTELADLTSWQPAPGAFDGVVLTFVHLPSALRRDVHQRLVRALREQCFPEGEPSTQPWVFLLDHEYTEHGLRWQLLKGLDPLKDQSYFLHRLNQAQLAKTLFPVGELPKAEVRRIAAEIGLPNAKKKDSTGICFIGERPFREFLNRYLQSKPGPIKNDSDRIIGKHMGLSFYTLDRKSVV